MANTAAHRNPVSSKADERGAFVRQANAFTATITADGSSGYRAEAGSYHIYVSHACPWASRAVIVRGLMGLENTVSLSAVDPIRDERGWAFRDGPNHSVDPVNGFSFLMDAYKATDPSFEGRATVPAVWDRASRRIVTNDFHTITLQLETAFDSLASKHPDLYPVALRAEIGDLNHLIYDSVNNGVYKAGFARNQQAYEHAVRALFAALETLDERLGTRRYLMGSRITEADVRLFTTLVRFDAVYHYHFKCNLARLTDYRHLWAYARDLYQTSGFGDTVDFDHIKRHYYMTHPHINPWGIVPLGPAVDWMAPHGRADLGRRLSSF